MSNEPITWETIPGLTPEERDAGKQILDGDLQDVKIEETTVGDVFVPKIVDGVVMRD